MSTAAQMSLENSIAGLERAGILPPGSGSGSGSGDLSRPHTSNGPDSTRPPRPDARVASYFNYMPTRLVPSTDSPPSYAMAASQSCKRPVHDADEILPAYSCPALMAGPMYMLLESCSPFVVLPCPEWRQVYVEMRGTQLRIYKLKNKTAGRLLTTYTLQQAEVGVAVDVTHNILVPATRLAGLIPTVARRKAFTKDPSLFTIEKQYALRVRAELDQFVLATRSEQQSYSWISHIAAGIDLAPPIDDRSLPRQVTIPRRRRRQRQNMNDQAFIAQQEHIMRTMYPNLGTGETPAAGVQPLVRPATSDRAQTPLVRLTGPGEQDNEDIDLSAIAEDPSSTVQRSLSTSSVERITSSRQTQISSTFVHEFPIAHDANLDVDGKWAPPHPRSGAQQLRYIRRCMPVLAADSPRHSSVLIFQGKLVRPNARMLVLEEWVLQPPAYDLHEFAARPVSHQSEGQECSSSVLSAVASSGTDIQRIDSPLLDREPESARSLHKHKRSDRRTDSTLSPLDKVVQSAEMQQNVIGLGY